MLPLTLLRAAQGQEILVELKNGETCNGVLVNIDAWMNLQLKNVTRTSKDGENFWSVKELFVRGNTVKYLRMPDKAAEVAVDNMRSSRGRVGRGRGQRRRGGAGGRGGRGGRGRHNGRSYGGRSRYDSD